MINIDACWLWPGKLRKSDGRATAGRRYAYRLIYEAATGQRCPEGVAHHRCENSRCVNPWHLEFITHAAHAKRHGAGGDWGNADKTECPQHHPYDDENTYWYTRKNGSTERGCRECRRHSKRRHRNKCAGKAGV